MKIYTKTGDRGQTGLVGGTRVDKDHLRIQAIGDVDEVNSLVGVCRCDSEGSILSDMLAQVQNWLFELGAELATPNDCRFSNKSLSEVQIQRIELSIDALEGALAPLRNFILPGGSRLSASLHLARSACRRAERRVVELDRHEAIRDEAKIFLNRLSDWFFVAARTANLEARVEDIEWKKLED